MAIGNLPKIAYQKAAEACARFELTDDARALLRGEHTPAQFLDALLAKNLLHDAAKFLAQALPKPEAVWWAGQCARTVAGPNPPAKIAAALEAVDKWVAEPNDANRRAAMAAGEAATFETPAGCAALAVFFSGGSMGPTNVAEIPPADNLTGNAAAGAVLLATVIKSPEKAPETLRGFVDQAVQIAAGQRSWKK